MTDHQFQDVIRKLRIELQILNDRIAATVGLKPQDLDILDIIDREGPCTPSYLAARTGHHRATLTGVLARLEREHWIAREYNPSDARSALVTSTARFEELRRLYAPADAAATALSESLTGDERQVIHAALTQAIAMLRSNGDNAIDGDSRKTQSGRGPDG